MKAVPKAGLAMVAGAWPFPGVQVRDKTGRATAPAEIGQAGDILEITIAF